MSHRALAWLPVGVVVAFLAAWALAPAAARYPLLLVEVESSKALALLGFASAAFVFERGDYLRRAWLLLGACTLMLFARDVFALAAHPGPGDTGALVVQGVFAVVGNGCSVLGTWMLARTWEVAGLEGGQSRHGRPLLLLAIAVAVAVSGWPLVLDVHALAGGDVAAVVPLSSDVADALVIVLLAPLATTALALRGGVLLWPWAFLTANGLLWLVFDATYAGLPLVHVDAAPAHALLESLRTLATLYGFSAGFAQRGVRTLASA